MSFNPDGRRIKLFLSPRGLLLVKIVKNGRADVPPLKWRVGITTRRIFGFPLRVNPIAENHSGFLWSAQVVGISEEELHKMWLSEPDLFVEEMQHLFDGVSYDVIALDFAETN